MSDPRIMSDRSWITSLAIGLILGVLLGFGTSLVFLLIIVGPVIGVGLSIAGLTGGMDRRSRANVGGGLLIGMGGFYVLGAINTLESCQGQDVCGGASALPLLGFGLVIVAVGVLVEGITFTTSR